MALKYYVIDTETTGLKASYNEMTEIGIVRCEDRVQIWRQIKCNYPERSSFDALKITKKTLADLQKGLTKEQVVKECNKFFEEDLTTPAHRCIVAHNAAFDRRFLHALWQSCDQKFPANLWLDTLALTKNYAKKIGILKPKVRLEDACNLVGIKKLAGAHNALVDSRNTYLLHRDLVEVKKIDYLPFIKTAIHQYSLEEERLDPDLLNE